MQLSKRYAAIAVLSCTASFAALSSCGGHPPTPGETCTPKPGSEGACYDPDHLVYCQRQSDGAYRWSEFLECSSDTRCSCAAGKRGKNYPNIDGACNCWSAGTPAPTRDPEEDFPASPDAAPTTEQPPPRTCAGGAAVCRDFEDSALHERVDGIVSGHVTMTAENTYAASGKQALRIALDDQAPTNISEGQINFVAGSGGSIPPFPLNDVYGRLMIYVVARPAVSWEFIRTQDASDQTSTIGVHEDGSLVLWAANGGTAFSKTKLPEGKWTCVQWETRREPDGSATISLQLDGQPVELGGGAARHSMPFDALFVGFSHFTLNESKVVVGEIWLDDIGFGEHPIPCTR
jgi:hypothetical protein